VGAHAPGVDGSSTHYDRLMQVVDFLVQILNRHRGAPSYHRRVACGSRTAARIRECAEELRVLGADPAPLDAEPALRTGRGRGRTRRSGIRGSRSQ
jgi:hypothetical protein